MLLLLDAYAPPPPPRHMAKLIASYSMSHDGKLKRDILEYVRKQEQEEAEMIEALLAWWNND